MIEEKHMMQQGQVSNGYKWTSEIYSWKGERTDYNSDLWNFQQLGYIILQDSLQVT